MFEGKNVNLLIALIIVVVLTYMYYHSIKKEGFKITTASSNCNIPDKSMSKRNVDITNIKSGKTEGNFRNECWFFNGVYAKVNGVHQCHNMKEFGKDNKGICYTSSDFESIYRA